MSNFDNLNTTPTETIEELHAKLATAQASQAVQSPEKGDQPEPTNDTSAPEIVAERVQDEPEQAPAENALVAAQGSGFLATIENAGDTMGALMAATEVDDGGTGKSNLFPILTQASGTSGGAFERARHMTDDEAGNLPEGRKPFTAVFLGYRFLATAWPEGYNPNGEKKSPVFSAALPASESQLVTKLMRIGKNYQFFSGDRGAFDVANGGPGHIRPQIEMLLFDPDAGELFTYQTCSHYNSTADTRDQLLKNATTVGKTADGKDQKAMLPFVGTFQAKTHKSTSKRGRDIVYHWCQIDKLDITDSNARTAWEGWQKFSADARSDASVMQRVNDWFGGADAPISADARQKLNDGDTIS